MEGLLWLLVLLLLIGPLLGTIAFFRSHRLKEELRLQEELHKSAIGALRSELADLRRALAKLTDAVEHGEVATAARQDTGSAAEPEKHKVEAPALPASEAPKPTVPKPEPLPAPPEPAKPVAPPIPTFTPVRVEVPPVIPPKPPATPVSQPVSASVESSAPAAVDPKWDPWAGPRDAQVGKVPPAAKPPVVPPPPSTEAPRKPLIPPIGPLPQMANIPPRPPEPPRASAYTTVGNYAPLKYTAPRKSLFEQLRAVLPVEEVLGMNWLSKIGIVLLVVGVALFGKWASGQMGPLGKVGLLYLVSLAMLGGGIYVEARERYRLIGRTGIGGGWALLFFTTYATHFVQAMTVITSQVLCCEMMLIVAVVMVWHTLRYQSQLVTGLSFLLAFVTVALSENTVYSLTAGAILAVGIMAIALKQGWYELEVFGIIASFLNHLYWLWRMYPGGVAGHAFPEFWPSTAILLLYWLTFRISYVVREIRSEREEQISTVAALLNTGLLLAVMRYQASRPELAFYALLVLGAMEFFFGQLPAARRRRVAFIILTVMGTVLMFAAVPFKFTGNNIAVLWIVAAEVLIVAGIVQNEVVFRRLGLLTGLFTGLLIAYNAWHIVQFRLTSEARLTHDGVLLLTAAAVFYLNAHFVRQKWSDLFDTLDGRLATTHSYIGGITAFIGAWGVFTHDWAAVAWAVLMVATAFGARRLVNGHLLLQCFALANVTAWRAIATNCHLGMTYPNHVVTRLITLPLLAVAFYLSALAIKEIEDTAAGWLRTLMSWAGTGLLATLAYLEVSPLWLAVVLMMFGVALAVIGRRFNLSTLCYQQHALAFLSVLQLLAVNLHAENALHRYVPFVLCAVALYAISRFCTVKGAEHARVMAWLHTWAATGVLAALAWHESPQVWVAPLWAAFALALAIIDRIFEVEELPYQAHVLAAMAVMTAAAVNIHSTEQWHNLSLRLITMSIVIVALYLMARWVRVSDELREREFHHVYSWVGSFLAAWLLWSELQAVAVAVGLAVFGLVLFEWGTVQKATQLRRQAYVTLSAAFVRIFFANLTAEATVRLYTIVPIALIFFFVWWQLQSEKGETAAGRISIADLVAYFGTASITVLLYFQTSPEWIVASWAVMVMVLMAVSLLVNRAVFQHQATLLTFAIVARGVAHNLYGGSYFASGGWRGNFAVLTATSAVLLATLPLAFRLRNRYAMQEKKSKIGRFIAAAVERPDQLQFFAPVLLITLMIAVKMNPGMVTLAWGLEGVLVFVLALLVGQRSYRLTGLALLLLCVGKIVVKDAWRLAERDRYITFIVLGAAILLVSFLYSKYRESMRQYL